MKYILYISLIIFFLIIFKVFYIQVIEYKKLNKLANELWSRNLTVASDRGKILDRNGKTIVDNITTASLYLVPNQIVDKEDTSGLPKSYRWNDVKYIMIPNVIGMTKKEAKKELKGLKVEYVGSGDKVIDTSPQVNTRVKENSIIKVLLN